MIVATHLPVLGFTRSSREAGYIGNHPAADAAGDDATLLQVTVMP